MAPYYSDHNSRLHQHQHSYTSKLDELHQLHASSNHHQNHYDHHQSSGLLYLEGDFIEHHQFISASQASLAAAMLAPPSPMQHYLTIEELRLARNSCWLCGCNWQQDHVSLDCPECGGYALSRPCPNCDGKCQQIWNRNINTTHDSHKASWTGQCSIHNRNQLSSSAATTTTTTTTTSTPTSNGTTKHTQSHAQDHNNTSNQNINNRRDKIVFDQLAAAAAGINEKRCDQTRAGSKQTPPFASSLPKNLCLV